jgi:hypothetical protein
MEKTFQKCSYIDFQFVIGEKKNRQFRTSVEHFNSEDKQFATGKCLTTR